MSGKGDTEFSATEVQEHNTKKDLYLIIHGKVYNSSSFVDEHPGGEEVLLDVGGQDATEAFEDVGHSDEAREVLEGLLIGHVKGGVLDATAKKAGTDQISAGPSKTGSDASSGIMLYAVLVLGAAIAYGAYAYLQSSETK